MTDDRWPRAVRPRSQGGAPVRRRAAALVGVTLLTIAAPVSAAAPASRQDAKRQEQARVFDEALARDDCKAAFKTARPLLGGAGPMNERGRASVYEALAECEYRDDDNAKALDHALAGTSLEPSSDNLWYMRLWLELELNRLGAAVTTVEAMDEKRPIALNSADISWLVAIDRKLKRQGDTGLRRRLLKVLASSTFLPDNSYGPVDSFRVDYARLLLAAGEATEAETVLASLASPRALAKARVDARLRLVAPTTADLRTAAEKQLARHREAAAIHPDRLGPILLIADNLLQLGRPQEALELLRSLSDRVDLPAHFSDRSERLNWYWDALGQTLATLGRYDDMVAAYTKGIALEERGQLNVSQVINLAGQQNDFGRGADALKTMAVFEQPARKGNEFGQMQMRATRGCAYALSGDATKAAADFDYLKAHDADAPAALTDFLLCTGDVAGAAAALVERLEDPERQADALLLLSDFDRPPVARPVRSEVTLGAVKARPEVQAAISLAGGTIRIPLQAF